MGNQALSKLAKRCLAALVLLTLAGVSSMASPAIAKTATPRNAAPAEERALTAPTGAASVFGIDDGGVLAYTQNTITLAAGTGVKWERISLYWSYLEPTQGNYDFATADQVLLPLLAAGFSPIVYLEHNPAWVSNTLCGPVNNVGAFAKMFGLLAARYPQVKIWAAYNEVDFDYPDVNKNTGGCFGSRTKGGVNNNKVKDFVEYAKMLAAARKAVHAANPNAQFASGAVAYDNFNPSTAPAGYPGGELFNYKFLPSLFNYMQQHPLPKGGKYMDMLLFNYYNLYGPYWQTKASGSGIQAKTKVLRKLMSDYGVPVVPLFVTETGEYSTTDGSWTDANGQARCLSMTMIRGAAVKLTGVIWWTFRDFPDDAPAPQNKWKYGIVTQDLQPKPSYTALKTLVSELNGLGFSKIKSNKTGFKGIESYYFVGSGQQKYVVWGFSKPNPPPPWKAPECGVPRNTAKATFQANTLRVVDYLGTVNTVADNSPADLDPAAGSIAIMVGADPLIVQINPQ